MESTRSWILQAVGFLLLFVSAHLLTAAFQQADLQSLYTRFLGFLSFQRHKEAAENNGIRFGGMPELHVFFHVFAHNASNATHAFQVIKEQQTALRASGVEASATAVHYCVIGSFWDSLVLEPKEKYQKSLNSGLEGGEKLSLESLWNHCRQHPSNNVLYIHSKGTFHRGRNNELLRKAMMHSLLDPCCLTALSSNLKHNEWGGVPGEHGSFRDMGSGAHDVCGMRFSPLPHAHFPGNMWWARCDYIRRLRPPSGFEADMHRVARRIHGLPSPARFPWPSVLGIRRWSSEHWVASHPGVRALDSLPAGSSPNGATYLESHANQPDLETYPWKPVCSRAPRREAGILPALGSVDSRRSAVPSKRWQEYALLYGKGSLDVSEGSQANDPRDCSVSMCLFFNGMAKLLRNEMVLESLKVKKYRKWMADYDKAKLRLKCSRACSKGDMQ